MSDNDLTAPKDGDSELVRKLREEIKNRDTKLSEATSELTTVKKETAFRAAGLDPKRGPGALLFKAYDGDFSEDSVKAAAEEYGISPNAPTQEPASEQQEEQQIPSEEQQINRTIDGATSGATATGASDPDPEQLGREAFSETFANTGSREKAAAAHFDAKMRATVEQKKKQKAAS